MKTSRLSRISVPEPTSPGRAEGTASKPRDEKGRHNESALLHATRDGHREIVDLLLPEVTENEDLTNALSAAAARGHWEIVELLLPRVREKEALMNALSAAAARGHRKTVELLLAKVPEGSLGDVLCAAAMNGHREIVDLLLPRVAEKEALMNALSAAAARGHRKTVRLLLAKIPEGSLRDVLCAAARNGHRRTVEILLSRASNTCDLGYALSAAATRGHRKIVYLLLPIVTEESELKGALCAAARNGDREILDLLLSRFEEGRKLEDALCAATWNGHRGIVDLLLPQVTEESELKGALCAAARNGDREILDLLLSRVTEKTKFQDVLCAAAKNGRREIVDLLLPKVTEEHELVDVLCAAAWNGHREIVNLLLPRVPKECGLEDALCAAARSGYLEIVDLLLLRVTAWYEIRSAFQEAVMYGRRDVIERLFAQLSEGLELVEAIDLAAANGQREIVDRLLPGVTNKSLLGNALCSAAQFGHVEITEDLVAAGVPVNSRCFGGLQEERRTDRSHQTPLDCALQGKIYLEDYFEPNKWRYDDDDPDIQLLNRYRQLARFLQPLSPHLLLKEFDYLQTKEHYVWRDKWIDWVSSCESVNVDRAENAATKCFRAWGHSSPGEVIFVGGPREAAAIVPGVQFRLIRQGKRRLARRVLKRLVHHVTYVDFEEFYQVPGREVLIASHQALAKPLPDRFAFGANEIWKWIWNSTPVGRQGGFFAGLEDNDPINDGPFAGEPDQIAAIMMEDHELVALAIYDYLASVCGLPRLPWVDAYVELAQSCGGWALMRAARDSRASFDGSASRHDGEMTAPRVMIIQHRPCEVHRVGGRLHRDGGPALRYPDGYSGWAMNGVTVPQWLAETPAEQIDPRRLVEIQNAEVRREFVRKVGLERLPAAFAAMPLDKLGDYELLDLNLGDGRFRPYLKMRNPSLGCWHFEGVEPSCRTVQAALTWRNSIEEPPNILT